MLGPKNVNEDFAFQIEEIPKSVSVQKNNSLIEQNIDRVKKEKKEIKLEKKLKQQKISVDEKRTEGPGCNLKLNFTNNTVKMCSGDNYECSEMI